MGFGPLELMIVLFLVFLLLGPKRIAGLLKASGRGLYDFTESLGRGKKDMKEKEIPEEDAEEKKRIERK
ncbi:MAG: twin-arginine translocase TatA/TatE family subunit [Rubrobacter sp.]|jgi:sec-independent protein translocase protein TatA|nr:twin-arginine translocase TatA/TatE family subunit [Rubrobacter sp.]